MTPQESRKDIRLVRTSVLIPEDTDKALRKLADDGNRPLSREVRQALEEHVARVADDRNPESEGAAA